MWEYVEEEMPTQWVERDKLSAGTRSPMVHLFLAEVIAHENLEL